VIEILGRRSRWKGASHNCLNVLVHLSRSVANLDKCSPQNA